MWESVEECTGISESVWDGTRGLGKVPECGRVLRNAQECMRVPRMVLECLGWSQSVGKC